MFLAQGRAFVPGGALDKVVYHFAGGGVHISRQQVEQPGFAASIGPGDNPMLTGGDAPGYVLQQRCFRPLHTHVLQLDHAARKQKVYSRLVPVL
jgi:hypothetical protein